jgi:hypothetical protein
MQNINQFSQTAERGQYALGGVDSNVISAQIDASLVGTLKTGDGVKIIAVSKGLPKVVPTTGVADIPAGFLVFNPVKNEYAANDRVEIAITGSFRFMVASAAIAAGANVQYDPATGKVATASAMSAVANTSTGAVTITPSTACGVALEAAAADGDLIVVKVAGTL